MTFGKCLRCERNTQIYAKGMCICCYNYSLRILSGKQKTPEQIERQKKYHKKWLSNPENARRVNVSVRISLRKKFGYKPSSKKIAEEEEEFLRTKQVYNKRIFTDRRG